jgi:hypothetical protein
VPPAAAPNRPHLHRRFWAAAARRTHAARVNRGFTPTAHMLVRRGHPRDGRWTRPGACLCFVAIPIVRSEANALAKAIMASGRRWLLSPSTSYVAATRLWPQ